jgi:hypothetical protein
MIFQCITCVFPSYVLFIFLFKMLMFIYVKIKILCFRLINLSGVPLSYYRMQFLSSRQTAFTKHTGYSIWVLLNILLLYYWLQKMKNVFCNIDPQALSFVSNLMNSIGQYELFAGV